MEAGFIWSAGAWGDELLEPLVRANPARFVRDASGSPSS
jgi:hypothetical protein